jgi:lipoprotein-anchoring transpeptidase ErfK/SrfK
MLSGAEPMTDRDRPLLEAARQAAKNGQRRQARELLEEAIRQDPADYRAWLWLSGLSSSPRASLAYVARAEILKPDDSQVQRARAWAERRLAATPTDSPNEAEHVIGQSAAVTKSAPQATPAERSHPKAERRPISWLVAGTAAALMIVLLLAVFFFWSSSTHSALAASLESLSWRPPLGKPQTGTGLEPGTSFTGIGNDENRNSYGETALVPVSATETTAGAVGTSSPVATATAAATATPLPTATATPIPTATPKSMQPKPVAAAGEDVLDNPAPRATWTLTPTPSPTPTATATFAPTATTSAAQAHVARPSSVGINERWISVNLTTQTLTAYEGNTPVRSTLISSGLPRTPTVTGQFRIYLRYRSQDMNGYRLGYNYYLRDVPYVQYFYGNYGLHGTYWHNNFGRPMSHGCVNLPTPEAEWLFNWASIGTLVYVHY